MSKIEMAGQKKLVLITGRAYPELAEQVAAGGGAPRGPTAPRPNANRQP
jgi:ribose-phosphate pyrophosphokinase